MSSDLPPLDAADRRRYSRQILLDEIGPAGQARLAAAKVLVVGAGGLGSPVALYLAAAGVGTIGIADLDRVEEHNLQRQLLHATADIGRPKVESARARLQALNPRITVVAHGAGIRPENAVEIFAAYDVIVDGTDNFPVRYLNNDAAFLARRPLVHGSVFKFEGQVTVFDPAGGGPCYRCLFPEPPAAGSVPGCGEAGVLGALCGLIGSLQALEVVKLVTGIAPPLRGRLVICQALEPALRTLAVPRDPHCPLCGSAPRITAIDAARYAPACTVPSPAMNDSDYPWEISVTAAAALLDDGAGRALLIDVREPHELAICQVGVARHIPMRQIPEHAASLPRDRHLLIMCHHGGRSRRVTEFLRAQGFDAVTNVAGGIDAWAAEIDPALDRY